VAAEKEKKKIDSYEKAILSFGEAVKAFRKGDHEKAVESFQALVEKHPSEMEIVDRAKAYMKIYQDISKKEILPSKTFDDLYESGVFLMNLGKYEEALKFFTKAIEENPDHAKILYFMAAIYQSMGDSDQSLEFLQKAIQKDKYFKILAQNDSDFEDLRENKKFKLLTKLA
jgi:tetratricopeptide (TPR) repeat protein